MAHNQESRIDDLIGKMIARAIEDTKGMPYKGKPSVDFPSEWRTLMHVTGLLKQESKD